MTLNVGNAASFLTVDESKAMLVIEKDAAPSWFAGTYPIEIQSKYLDSDKINSTAIDLTIYCPTTGESSEEGEL